MKVFVNAAFRDVSITCAPFVCFFLCWNLRKQIVTVVQWHFRTPYGKPAPIRQSVYDRSKKFQNTGCLCKGKSSGRPPAPGEQVTSVCENYMGSLKKLATRASLEL